MFAITEKVVRGLGKSATHIWKCTVSFYCFFFNFHQFLWLTVLINIGISSYVKKIRAATIRWNILIKCWFSSKRITQFIDGMNNGGTKHQLEGHWEAPFVEYKPTQIFAKFAQKIKWNRNGSPKVNWRLKAECV